ncbi:rubrerythrin family protein, partial [Candidatus Woesearchaeota archaeon]
MARVERKRIDENVLKELVRAQKNEITEHRVYKKLAEIAGGSNEKVLNRISSDELRHYQFWKSMTGREVKPSSLKVWWYVFLAKALGVNFSLKLMERGEDLAAVKYAGLSSNVKEAERIMKDEQKHEKELLEMLEEERLEYASSIVLGLNDALVELTGALAGLTLALQNSRMVAMAGFITGFAASLSMAASEYLSSKEEKGKNPLKSATYTGIAYIITVLLLIS